MDTGLPLKRLLCWLVFMVCLCCVLYAIFRPTPPAVLFENSDKVGHLIAFFALSVTGRLALVRVPSLWFWIIMIELAFVLEYLQGLWLPRRQFSLEDSYANLLGVAIAWVVLKSIDLWRNR